MKSKWPSCCAGLKVTGATITIAYIMSFLRFCQSLVSMFLLGFWLCWIQARREAVSNKQVYLEDPRQAVASRWTGRGPVVVVGQQSCTRCGCWSVRTTFQQTNQMDDPQAHRLSGPGFGTWLGRQEPTQSLSSP